MTRSRALRFAAAVLAAVAALAGVWIVGGNAWAARREAAAELAFEGTFGSRAALEAKYAVAGSNAEAQRVEELAKAVGFDLSPHVRAPRIVEAGDGFSEKERAAVNDYVTAQLVRTDDSVSAPSPEVVAVLDGRRAPLTAFEEFLATAPPPRWPWDPATAYDERRVPNLLGHIRLQRFLIADALASAIRGDGAAAGRAVEASWKLNEGLASRPEVVSRILATAIARYEAGALRKVNAGQETWTPRLAAMGSRARLVEAVLLDHPRPADMAARYRGLRPAGVGWWAHNLVSLLEEPRERLADADYGEAWVRAIAGLRDEPAFGEPPPEAPPGRDAASVTVSIVIPNHRETFRRADRLALDAELTGKILRVKDVRRAQRAWPQPSAEIAASHFPGLSWNYAVDGGVMTIALNRDVQQRTAGLVLPTSFSSRAAAP